MKLYHAHVLSGGMSLGDFFDTFSLSASRDHTSPYATRLFSQCDSHV